MTKNVRIIVAEPQDFGDKARAILGSIGHVDIKQLDQHTIAQALNEYDVFWFRLAWKLDAQLINGIARCKIIATPVTGTDHIDLEACARKHVQVASLRGEREFLREVRATAELTLALAFALLRHLPRAANDVLQGHWNRDAFRGRELYQKTAGIIGLGRLGSITADYCRALGMRVIGYDPSPTADAVVERKTTLDAVLKEADVLSLHVSYGPSTHHLIGARELSQLKPTSVLINTSRGAVVDSAALLSALQTGKLSGAALDVIEGEPHIDASHPLIAYARTHDNLIIVPHIGGNTTESFEKTEVFLAEKVVRMLGAT